MPREYRHIKQYEKEIIKLWEQGVTLREIAERFGFTKEQVQESELEQLEQLPLQELMIELLLCVYLCLL